MLSEQSESLESIISSSSTVVIVGDGRVFVCSCMEISLTPKTADLFHQPPSKSVLHGVVATARQLGENRRKLNGKRRNHGKSKAKKSF